MLALGRVPRLPSAVRARHHHCGEVEILSDSTPSLRHQVAVTIQIQFTYIIVKESY